MGMVVEAQKALQKSSSAVSRSSAFDAKWAATDKKTLEQALIQASTVLAMCQYMQKYSVPNLGTPPFICGLAVLINAAIFNWPT